MTETCFASDSPIITFPVAHIYFPPKHNGTVANISMVKVQTKAIVCVKLRENLKIAFDIPVFLANSRHLRLNWRMWLALTFFAYDIKTTNYHYRTPSDHVS